MDEGSQTGWKKLVEKMQADPIVPVGIAGLVGVVGYSAFNLRKRKQKLSIYLIHTRVAAQGTLMACMTLGLIYTIINKHWNKFFPEKNVPEGKTN